MQRILYCHHKNTPQWKFFIAMSHVISDQLGAKIIWCKLHFFVFYYSSGKTWNTFIHVSFFAAVCTALYHRVAFFCQSTDVSVQLEALDILGDLLSRFGGT